MQSGSSQISRLFWSRNTWTNDSYHANLIFNQTLHFSWNINFLKCDLNQGYALFESINDCEIQVLPLLVWFESQASMILINVEVDSNK